MLNKNIVFHVSELAAAEMIMNIYEDIMEHKAELLKVNPNVTTNIHFDYADNSFFVHLRSDIALTEEEYWYFEFANEYVYLLANHDIQSVQDYRNILTDIRYRKRGMFEKKTKNIFKGLSFDDMDLDEILAIVAFFNNEDIYLETPAFQKEGFTQKEIK